MLESFCMVEATGREGVLGFGVLVAFLLGVGVAADRSGAEYEPSSSSSNTGL